MPSEEFMCRASLLTKPQIDRHSFVLNHAISDFADHLISLDSALPFIKVWPISQVLALEHRAQKWEPVLR